MRTILHCDLNSFYASVEIHNNPELRGKAVAVCGSKEDRHGIVLAKSDLAKAAGVQTGEAIWQAQQKCPELIIVPPHYDEYLKFSRLARNIYEDYTDLIEPFGIDECWLDVTASLKLFGSGEEIAETIRQRMKDEVGLTISVGVSFNKIFAKLGSDMKKPDAITVIPYESFKEKIWHLPASDMLGVGRATAHNLVYIGVETIGDLANTPEHYLKYKFGKCGSQLWYYANGLDNSPVQHMHYAAPLKSVGHGSTCVEDLISDDQVRRVFIELAQDVSHRLRKYCLKASSIQISVRDCELGSRQYQCPLELPTQSFSEIADKADELFRRNYGWEKDIRGLTIRAINLMPADSPIQYSLTMDINRHNKRDKVEQAMEKVRARYGYASINVASSYLDLKLPGRPVPNTLPTATH